MSDKKGFTLIELIAVIIILAIIALISTPIILNVVEDAKKSAGESEANMVLKGITDYCEQEKMGIAKTDYCTDSKKINDNLDKIVNLGKLEKKDIEVSVKDGKLDWLKVTSNGKDFGLQDGKLVEGITERQPNLINILLNQYNPENTVGLIKDGNTDRYYYKGTNEDVSNNFLWYGGHQWRILEFDKKAKTLKLITQQPVTAIYPIGGDEYEWKSKESYDKSYVNEWLNQYFLKTLPKNVQNNLVDYNFRVFDNIETTHKIGLLEKEKYYSFLAISDEWLLANKYDGCCPGGVRSNNSFSGHNEPLKNPTPIRPVIIINDIYIEEGIGSLVNNFKIIEEKNITKEIQVGDYIKVPYEGKDNACGIDKKCMFRVVLKNESSLKISLNGILPQISEWSNDGENHLKTTDLIYVPLNNFVEQISKEYRTQTPQIFNVGDYDLKMHFNSVSSTSLTAEVGLPVIGEIFTCNDIDLQYAANETKKFVDINTIENPFTSSAYWTMNMNLVYKKVLTVDSYGGLSLYGTKYIDKWSVNTYGVRPVIFLRNDLKLVSGDGSPSAPYELK